ncbi:NAD(P)H-dependent flavin oxidoreductase [Sciscionella sediminilitoris]|uniref:NAD(P)H-dependent flavin oxidoreductase n=1 Tax=Sciscionella sediminilitoris TaxID=1445613 RepID=UPI000AEACBB2
MLGAMFTQSPVILGPMAGGVSTPELVAAVSEAGGFAFLPSGYLSATEFATQWARTHELTGAPFGANLFVPGAQRAQGVREYAERLVPDALEYGIALGEARFEDDEYAAKLELLIAQRAPVVSFTFGLPTDGDVRRLHAAGSTVVATVTTQGEAAAAAKIGVDVLVAQGIEAGGHRGGFDPGQTTGMGLLALIGAITTTLELPVIAAGGIMRPADVSAVRTAGAVAAQCGTAFLRCPEAGTKQTHRNALAKGNRDTTVTKAFTGRAARALTNTFIAKHDRHAPTAYPQVHHLTKPLRTAAAEADDPERLHLWAGQGYRLGKEEPAAEVLRYLTSGQ